MFVMANETGLSHLLSVENVMAMKSPFASLTEVKPAAELRPHRQTVLIEENKMAVDTPAARPAQAKGDIDTVRQRLRESLVSALEMVVGKQVIKGVLGVGTGEEPGGNLPAVEQGSVGDVNRVKENEVEVELASQQDVTTNLDTKNLALFAPCARRSSLPIHVYPGIGESSDVVSESPLKKSKISNYDSNPVSEENIGGLQLMEQVRRVAWDIEVQLLLVMGGVNKKYKEKARSLLFNLKDKSNPELRARVFSGEITPGVLVRMTGEQLASKELSQWRTAKAEALASMVVLTDADVDPRRIVKKTHKGEFQVMTESEPNVQVIEPPASSLPSLSRRESDEGVKVEQSPSSGSGIMDSAVLNKALLKSSPSSAEEKRTDKISDTKAAADTLNADLPTIMSLDEYLDTRQEVKPKKSDLARVSTEGRNGNKGSPSLQENLVLPASSTASPSNANGSYSTPKLNRSPGAKTTDLISSVASTPKKREREHSGPLWEGSVQLSATRFAPVDGILKSGEKLDAKDWPRSVEVKGRVRLTALDKFLQDLQSSRSRTVTVLSICPSSRQGADLKQVRAYLKEMADQYRTGDRAGFVEPAQGFELYLVAPGCASLDILGDLPTADDSTLERDDEILVGVVVWRRNQSQGLLSTRGPEHQIGSLRKSSMSNQVSESPTKVSTTPIRLTETPTSAGALPTSLKTTSAHVVVSGNSSMHSTPSGAETPAIRDLSVRREWPPSSEHQLSSVGVPPIRVIENIHAAVPNSLPVPQKSVELEDVPPGFLPRVLPPYVTPGRASVEEPKDRLPGFQPSLVGVSIPNSVLVDRERGREVIEAPPGFWPRPPVKAGLVSSQVHTSSLGDDDDLPEFNFEAEGAMAPQQNAMTHTTANVLPTQSNVFGQNSTSVHTQPPSNLANMCPGDPVGRPPGMGNGLITGVELNPVSALPFPRRIPVQEESYVLRNPMQQGRIIDGWHNSDGRLMAARVQPNVQHVVSRQIPLNPETRTMTVGGGREDLAQRQEDHRGYGVEAQRGSISVYEQQRNVGMASSGVNRTVYGIGVEETMPVSRNDLPEWGTSVANLQAPQRASLATPLSTYETTSLLRLQTSAVQRTQQHSITKIKNGSSNWVRGGQQESRYDYGRQSPASGSTTAKWQLNSSSQNRSRKVDNRDKVRTANNPKDIDRRRGGRDRSRVRERSRERSLTPSPEREKEQVDDRRTSRSPTPLRDRSPQSRDARGQSVDASEQRDVKLPRRERERDQ